ncbi:MAG: TRAP transporter small permease [Thermofilaceae archaeon]
MITELNKKIYSFLCASLILPLIVSTVVSSMLRYVFRAPNMWLWYFSIWFYGISFSLGGAYLLYLGGHTSVDAVFKFFPRRIKTFVEVINLVAISIICFIILINAVSQAWYSTSILEVDSSVLEVSPPIWWYKWILAASLLLVGLQALALLKQKLTRGGNTRGLKGV